MRLFAMIDPTDMLGGKGELAIAATLVASDELRVPAWANLTAADDHIDQSREAIARDLTLLSQIGDVVRSELDGLVRLL